MKKQNIFIGIILLVGLAILWYLVSPLFIELEESNEELIIPTTTPTGDNPEAAQTVNHSEVITGEEIELVEPQPVQQGVFERIDYNVEGSFEIYEAGEGHLLRIRDLEISNGPDLYLVFSDENSSSIREFEIIEKLEKQGTFNVNIPPEIDPADYDYLHIHCVRFRHTFAGGAINEV